MSGTGTIRGSRAGSATIKVAVQRESLPFLGWFYAGYVSVCDPGAHLNTVALVLTPSLTRVAPMGCRTLGTDWLRMGRRLSMS